MIWWYKYSSIIPWPSGFIGCYLNVYRLILNLYVYIYIYIYIYFLKYHGCPRADGYTIEFKIAVFTQENAFFLLKLSSAIKVPSLSGGRHHSAWYYMLHIAWAVSDKEKLIEYIPWNVLMVWSCSVLLWLYHQFLWSRGLPMLVLQHLGPLLLTRFNFNPSIDK